MDQQSELQNSPSWEFKTIRHARRERRPTEYIVDKFLETHSVNIVYGAPGSLKSMIVLDMAIAVANGSNWLPGFNRGFPVMGGSVIWIDVDNGSKRTDQRVDAMSKRGNIPDDAPFYYSSMPDPALYANDIESMFLLQDAAVTLEAKLIVIDNLGLVTGDVDENSAMMAQIMRNFRTIAEMTGAAIVLIHHQRKGGAGQSRAGDALRGHSSIEAALDLALHVVRENNTNQITVTSTKTRGVDVPQVVADFWYRHIDGTNDLEEAWFEAVVPERGENPVRDAILVTVETYGEITKKKLLDVVYEQLNKEHSYRKIRAWVDDMIALSNELTVTDGDYNAKIISLS